MSFSCGHDFVAYEAYTNDGYVCPFRRDQGEAVKYENLKKLDLPSGGRGAMCF